MTSKNLVCLRLDGPDDIDVLLDDIEADHGQLDYIGWWREDNGYLLIEGPVSVRTTAKKFGGEMSVKVSSGNAASEDLGRSTEPELFWSQREEPTWRLARTKVDLLTGKPVKEQNGSGSGARLKDIIDLVKNQDLLNGDDDG